MRKAGIVSENDDGTKRIKLYRDEEGNVKGDGRCTYLRVESVNLAMQLLDESDIKPGFPVKIERVRRGVWARSTPCLAGDPWPRSSAPCRPASQPYPTALTCVPTIQAKFKFHEGMGKRQASKDDAGKEKKKAKSKKSLSNKSVPLPSVAPRRPLPHDFPHAAIAAFLPGSCTGTTRTRNASAPWGALACRACCVQSRRPRLGRADPLPFPSSPYLPPVTRACSWTCAASSF